MSAAATRLRRLREPIAQAVTDEFLARHPDWVVRYGDRARVRGVEDALFHLDFLAGALVVGDDGAFHAYARWAARMLASRGIAPAFLAENLRQIADGVEQALGGADGAVAARFARGGAQVALASVGEPEPQGPTDDRVGLFLSAAVMGDRRNAARLALDAAESAGDVIPLYTELLQAALDEAGRLWETGRLTVTQEHMATAVAQYVMSELRPRLGVAAPSAGRVLLTTPQGERHQVGAQMVCDVLEADGWSVHFVGSDVPHEGVVKAVVDLRPEVVGISAATLLSLESLQQLATAVRELRDPPRIVAGGAAFRSRRGRWETLAVDAVATDLREARTRFAALRSELQ